MAGANWTNEHSFAQLAVHHRRRYSGPCYRRSVMECRRIREVLVLDLQIRDAIWKPGLAWRRYADFCRAFLRRDWDRVADMDAWFSWIHRAGGRSHAQAFRRFSDNVRNIFGASSVFRALFSSALFYSL